MKAFYGMLMIFVLCSMCYILVDSQITLNDVTCKTSLECRNPCIARHGTAGHKCMHGRCKCYP
nr:putative KTx Tcis7 [Tityus cisandinus]